MTVKISRKNQEFIEANTPALPYTFQLKQMRWNTASFKKTEEIMLQNKKTNEEFSVRKKEYDIVEIKRAIKKVKN